MSYGVIGLLSLCLLLLVARLASTRRELRRLSLRTKALADDARHGSRLFSDSGDRGLVDLAGAVNSLVDAHEGRVRQTEKAESNIRLSISGISHDMRTPLTALSGHLQLLDKTELSDKQREHLAAIDGSARILSDLVDNFYDLSRLELGDDVFAFRVVDLEPFVCERFLAFYETFAARGLEVTIEDAAGGLEAVADPLALTRVLNNLIQNILRYASGTVSVAFADEPERAAVIVSNRTTDLLPDETDRLFERFFTADPSRSNRGSGLGLYISRQLTEGMGGAISAEKRGGDTLVLTIRLPKPDASPR
ncbi:MAG: HAMP domain-containing histidine kinase [Propionibacteriaceae bacterium]|nr:HAMP domain-containing histidine kinase [Propionibacteriaceae bacterium]